MSSAERIREIRETDLDIEDDFDLSKLKPPGDQRLWAFGLAAMSIVIGAYGLWKAPKSYDTATYSQDWVNERLLDRAQAGGKTKVVHAEGSMLGDVFAMEATASDGQRFMDMVVSGALKLDASEWVIRIQNPETHASEPYRETKSSGERAADAIPDMTGNLREETTAQRAIKGFVGIVESGARWTAGAVGNAASGQFMAEIQFPGEAKRAVWDMPIIQIPESDRIRMQEGSVTGVSMIDGQIVVSMEFWNLGVFAMLFFAMVFGGAALLAALIYQPHFLAE